MHGPRRIAALCALLMLPAGVWAAGKGKGSELGKETQAPASCPADVAAAITQLCPCDGFTTHGQYVRCVVHLAGALRRARCPGRVSLAALNCAVWSTCGKQAAVVCCTSTIGSCNVEPGETDAGCTTFSAHLAHDAAACAAAGGTSMGAGSVCTACTTSTTTTSTSTTTSTTSSTSTSTTTVTTATATTTTLAPGVDVGNDVEFPNASAHSPDYLLGSYVTLPAPAMLTHLCVITKAGGPNVILSLYSDGSGDPVNLMAETPPTPMTLGRMEIPVTPTPLPAGTYWVMGIYDSDASIGIDESNPNMPDRYTAQPFSSPLPDPFGPALEYSGQQFNYYMKVE